MPFPIPITTLGQGYTSFAQGSLYSSGYLLVANGAVDVEIDYGTKTGQAGSTVTPNLSSGQYELVAPAHNFIIGLRIRAANGVVSAPAQVVQGQLYEPTVPGIIPVGSGVIQSESVAIGFRHNGVSVGVEPNADFVDANGLTWAIADDAPNSQVTIQAVPVTENAVAQYPNDPVGTLAVSPGVMMGTGCSFTPTRGGRVSGAFHFNMAGGGFGNTINATVRFGTGAAPGNGAAPAGSGVIPINAQAQDAIVAWWLPWTINGMTAGTNFWFDLIAFFNPYGSANPSVIKNIGFAAWEV